MCPRGLGKVTRPIGHMTMKLYERIIDEIRDVFPNGYRPEITDKSHIVEEAINSEYEISGLRLHHFGEPLLDPFIVERIKYANENSNIPVHFSINPNHLTYELSKALIDAGLERLIIALDGTNDEEYKSIRGNSVSYEKAIANINELISLRTQQNIPLIIDLQMISLNQTKDRLNEFKKKWEEKGVNVYIKQFFPYPDVNHSEFMVQNEKNFVSKCMFPFISMVVLRDGTVTPCCSDYNGEIVLGNINDNSLTEIWNGEKYFQFRYNFIHNRFNDKALCKRCGFYKYYEFS
jgi:radical SAM protein with 4Fe4S-binding SPASM domain